METCMIHDPLGILPTIQGENASSCLGKQISLAQAMLSTDPNNTQTQKALRVAQERLARLLGKPPTS